MLIQAHVSEMNNTINSQIKNDKFHFTNHPSRGIAKSI